MIKKITGVAALGMAIFISYLAAQPNEFQILRSQQLQAPPDKLFMLINDFHQWELWSPWEQVDMTRAYSGALSGQGAVYEWQNRVNNYRGHMTIKVSTPTHIVIDIDEYKPYKLHQTFEFTLLPQDGATQVRVVISGNNNLLTKMCDLVVDRRQKDAEKLDEALTNLKILAEN